MSPPVSRWESEIGEIDNGVDDEREQARCQAPADGRTIRLDADPADQ